MNVLIENNFLTEKNIVISSLSHVYRQNLNSFIESTFLVELEEFPNKNLLKAKILYSNNELESPDFSNSKEFNLINLLDGENITFKTNTSIPVNNLYVYLYIFNDTGSTLTTYEKVFFEQLVNAGQVISGNFVDIRVENLDTNVIELLDQKQILANNFYDTTDDLISQNYISNLYYSIKEDNKINLFFGVDQKGYFKKKNFIGFIKNDKDYEDYLSNNTFITQINGEVYNKKDLFKIDPIESDIDLKYLLGTLHETTFQAAGDSYRTENYGYRIDCFLKNAIVEYALNVLNPALVNEANFLKNINLTQNEFIYVPKNSIKKTIDCLKGLIEENNISIGDIFTTFDKGQTILLSSELVNYFSNVNENIVKLLVTATDFKRTAGNALINLKRDFGQVIDARNIKNAANVHGFGLNSESIVKISTDQLKQRASTELQKYFNDTTTTVGTKSGITDVNLESLSLGYFSALSYIVDNKLVLANNKGVNYNFSIDDFLEYVGAINTITSEKLNYDFKISKQANLERVTPTEFNVEQKSEQISSILNSLTVLSVPEFNSGAERRDFLDAKTNVVKTFEIPSVLKTDVCVDNVTQSSPENEALTKNSATPQNFIGNNILAFSVLTNLKKFTDKNFYEFYRFLQNNDINPNDTPIQTVFLKKYYNGEIPEIKYLDQSNLYKNFVVYGLLYFLFKNLFKIMVYIPDQDEFVVLNENVLAQLDAGQNYLCLVDNYSNARTGTVTPEKLRTSIYNRYFVLEV